MSVVFTFAPRWNKWYRVHRHAKGFGQLDSVRTVVGAPLSVVRCGIALAGRKAGFLCLLTLSWCTGAACYSECLSARRSHLLVQHHVLCLLHKIPAVAHSVAHFAGKPAQNTPNLCNTLCCKLLICIRRAYYLSDLRTAGQAIPCNGMNWDKREKRHRSRGSDVIAKFH
jgi:hypothetical protein